MTAEFVRIVEAIKKKTHVQGRDLNTYLQVVYKSKPLSLSDFVDLVG
jgi:hypothetical protein